MDALVSPIGRKLQRLDRIQNLRSDLGREKKESDEQTTWGFESALAPLRKDAHGGGKSKIEVWNPSNRWVEMDSLSHYHLPLRVLFESRDYKLIQRNRGTIFVSV